MIANSTSITYRTAGDYTPNPALYYVGDYECNGYNDSDFYVVFWNATTGQLEKYEYATTRFPGGIPWDKVVTGVWDTATKDNLRAYLFAHYREAYTKAEVARVMEPQPTALTHGAKVRFTKGSGRSKHKWDAGDAGEVTWQGWFGTFHRNGYNTKGRHNGRVGVRLATGTTVFGPMSSVRLDREPDLEGAEEQAREDATRLRIPCPHAWWTNYALSSALD